MRDDDPDTISEVSRAVPSRGCERGIVVRGSGAGVAVDIAAGQLLGTRAAVGHDTYTAAQDVRHDDCTVLAPGAKIDVMRQEGFGD